MTYNIQRASMLDLARMAANRRKHRVLRLDAQHGLVQGDALLPELLKSQSPVRQQTSFLFVCRERGALLGYAQVRHSGRRRDQWSIDALALSEKAGEWVANDLVEGVCREAGCRGVLRVLVKLPHSEPHAQLFRQMGFTHYADEYIYGNLLFSASSASSHAEEPARGSTRRQESGDSWDLMQLYSAVTPPAVQRAEVLTSRYWICRRLPTPTLAPRGIAERCYVWPDEAARKGLGGYIRLLTGQRGHWINVMFRPDGANRAMCGIALDYILWKASRFGNKPVYCGIREYQAEMESMALERGFHPLSTQALLVKYLAEPIREQRHISVPFLVPRRESVAADFGAGGTPIAVISE
ncbi:MAG: hypothetical protein M3014_09895 [Chloroflexota bacterium]|nr:hypothetical protein [Chloroflexota bacterium]